MPSVLLIEDDVRIRESLARALASRGHDVDRLATGMEGLEYVIANAPDVVILDLGLPDLDGVEILKLIRAVSQVPVMAFMQQALTK